MSTTVESYITFRTKVFRAALTRPANTTTYAAGDVISAASTDAHYTFGSTTEDDSSGRISRPRLNSVSLNAVRLFSSANVSTKLDAELWLFHTDIAEVADNAAFAPTDAEVLTLAAVIAIPTADWVVGTATAGAGGNAVCQVRNIDLPLKTSGTGLLYGQLVARNAYAPVSGEIFTCDLVVTQD